MGIMPGMPDQANMKSQLEARLSTLTEISRLKKAKLEATVALANAVTAAQRDESLPVPATVSTAFIGYLCNECDGMGWEINAMANEMAMLEQGLRELGSGIVLASMRPPGPGRVRN
jgi:hypothetical protein